MEPAGGLRYPIFVADSTFVPTACRNGDQRCANAVFVSVCKSFNESTRRAASAISTGPKFDQILRPTHCPFCEAKTYQPTLHYIGRRTGGAAAAAAFIRELQ
jgi:hypothetical protein